MNRILLNRISKTVCGCTKGRLALTLTLTVVALFGTVGVLAKDYSSLHGGNVASDPASFMKSLPSLINTRFFLQKSSKAKASISTAKKGYVPGEAVTFRGEGFRPGETVSLRITHLDGTAGTSDLNNWQRITVGEDGTFTASISMSADGIGHDYVVAASGDSSGAIATAVYSRVALIETSKSSYDPGETAALVGSYFGSKESVTIQVTDSAGNNLREPLVAYADEAGKIAASWLVSPNDSATGPVLVTAKGDLSGLTAQAELPTPAVVNPVVLPSVNCPSNLNSCTAKDVTTTVKKVDILNNDLCTSATDTITLRTTVAYAATSNERYDLGLFVSGDGGTVKEPSSAVSCFGAAAQVGQGDSNTYPDADSDLFLNIDPTGHASTPNTADTCGDLRATTGPVDWTIDVTVECKIVNNTLTIPSCRVWEQNANHATSCQTLQQAGTGSKCDCTDLVVTTQLNPCATKICNDNNACTDDSCVVSGTPGNLVGTCVFTNDNTNTCGSSSDTVCDNPDTCNNGACQANNEPNTTVCRAAAPGGCDVAETCNAGVCPGDSFASGTTVCRAANGQCDVAESCTGSSAACPADGFAANTVTCTGTSQGGACDGTDHCAGNSNSCVDGFQPATTQCRAAAGQCDVAETCTGSSGACPANGFAAATTTCVGTSNGGACDGSDSCDGSGNCVDGYQPATTVCRASAGQCDVAESCTGSSSTCPANGFAPATTSCVGTSNGGGCDAPDSCDGAGHCVDNFDTPPTVTLALNPAACDDQGGATPTQLVATVTPVGPTYSYSWTGPDGPIVGNVDRITPTKPGTYTVVVTDTGTSCPNDGTFKLCFTGAQVDVASAAPTQQPQATASFTVQARPESIGFRAYLARLLLLMFN